MKPTEGVSPTSRARSVPSLVPTLVPLLGHQGGWDEILIVALPLLLIGGLLLIANRRVDAKLKAKEPNPGDPDRS